MTSAAASDFKSSREWLARNDACGFDSHATCSIADFCIFAIAHNDIICACVAIALAEGNYAIAKHSRADANIILRTHTMTVGRQMP
jgi:hypothetical protein